MFLQCECRGCTERHGRFSLCHLLQGVGIVLVIAVVLSIAERL